MITLLQFHFIRPYWLLALIPLALLMWMLRKQLKSGGSWKPVIDKHLLPYLLINVNKTRSCSPFILLGLMWIIAIFSLAGPTWSRLPQQVYRNESAKVILLDLSQSMLAQDVQPNRLSRAKYKILDILHKYPEGQTGMAVFSTESYTVSPLTSDSNTLANMVPVLSPRIMPTLAVIRSNLAVGLQKAQQLLQQDNAKRGTILLITDSKPTAHDDQVARRIRKQGDTLSILAVGTAAGAPIPNANGGFFNNNGKTIISKIDVAGLKKLAASGGGRFSLFSNNDSDIQYLLAPMLQNESLAKAKRTKATTALWQDEGRWPILLILVLLLMLFRRGWPTEII